MERSPVPPTSVPYFFGRITRERAEEILMENGCQTGLYLLRDSVNKPGDYVLCLCNQKKIHHYNIERQYDGAVKIEGGRKFSGPVELVEHHKTQLSGFVTYPTYPCNRPPGEQPLAFVNVTVHELEQELYRRATVDMKLKGDKLERAMTEQRQKLYLSVTKELHKKQPWYHKTISRDEADLRMTRDGHETGKFLVRERDGSSMALSISHDGITKHYIITKTGNGIYFIEDGPKFESLMDLIDHYHGRHDGLLCRLVKPCPHPEYKKVAPVLADMQPNSAYGSVSSPRSPISPGMRVLPPTPVVNRPPPPVPTCRLDEPIPIPSDSMNNGIYNFVWDDPVEDGSKADIRAPNGGTGGAVEATATASSSDADAVAAQKIYDSVPRSEDVFNLNANQLKLKNQLGKGQFGTVVQGEYHRNGQNIPVAIKTLKKAEDGQSMAAEEEIMKEAKIMAGLNHRNVVRLIGVCRGSDSLMLVLELAPLGQLNKHLKANKSTKVKVIIEIMRQVAEGMRYLESVKFVHRDLAARNVLLVTDSPPFAKISDFGMSKAIGVDSNYYKAASAGKWPLKWYAPECIYFFKFDSKSDVWSFGVTLWEAMSYGAKPYMGLKGAEIVRMLEDGYRLEKPTHCPQNVYEIMLHCWKYDKKERPSFVEVLRLMSNL